MGLVWAGVVLMLMLVMATAVLMVNVMMMSTWSANGVLWMAGVTMCAERWLRSSGSHVNRWRSQGRKSTPTQACPTRTGTEAGCADVCKASWTGAIVLHTDERIVSLATIEARGCRSYGHQQRRIGRRSV